MRTSLVLLLLFSSLAGQCAYQADGLATEKETLQGTWVPITLVADGREQSKDDLRRLKLTIKGDKYVYVIDGRSFTAAYKIDPDKEPKQMDITFEEGPQKDKTMLAVYSLNGDELKICGGDKRPVAFSSNPQSEVVLFVFNRETQ